MDLEAEIKKIQERNKRVEIDKAWETSFCRKVLIAIETYFVMVLVMLVLDIAHPCLSAIIPTLGFLLSTLGLNFAKSIWVKKYCNKE